MRKARLVRSLVIGALVVTVLVFGILPILTGERFRSLQGSADHQTISGSEGSYAVVVLGSEPEGIAAALAAARSGMRTLLVTDASDLGGVVANALLSHIRPQTASVPEKGGKSIQLNDGIYMELFGATGTSFTPDEFLDNVDRLVGLERNLEVLLATRLESLQTEGTYLRSVDLLHNGLTRKVRADIWIDATRDGDLLEMAGVPFSEGSSDIGADGVFEPVRYNFRISGVAWEDLLKIRDITDLGNEFRDAVFSYEQTEADIKVVNPSFIKQGESLILITGLQLADVDPGDPNALENARSKLETEARFLTVYIRETLIPFANARYEGGGESLEIPEYRHFSGRTTIGISSAVLGEMPLMRLAAANGPVTAGRFVRDNLEPVVVRPGLYGIPLASAIPPELDNVLMTGMKISCRSLAATSATAIPTTVTAGQGAGAVAAYCVLNQTTPAALIQSADVEEAGRLTDFMRHTGMTLPDEGQPVRMPLSDDRLADEWCWPQLEKLLEAGIVAGGDENDCRLDSGIAGPVLAVLAQNTLLRLAPDAWTTERAERIQVQAGEGRVSTEDVAAVALVMLGREPGDDARGGLLELDLLLDEAQARLSAEGPASLDLVYAVLVMAADRAEAER